MMRHAAAAFGLLLAAAHLAYAQQPTGTPDSTARQPVRPAVRLAFTGDVNLGTTTVPDGIPPDEGRGLLDSAAAALTGDLVIGNFEGVLADSGADLKCTVPPSPRRRRRRHTPPPPTVRPNCFAFRTPTALAPRLREAGFTHLNLANNHALDFGDSGLVSTQRTLDAAGLRHYGPLGQIAIDTVRGDSGATVVAVIGFTTYPFAYDLLDLERSRAVVDSVRKLADVVVVTFHGGAEGVRALHVPRELERLGREPRGRLREWSRAVIDAGADLVVGHGPHVLRGIEFYRGKPIAYSLGNFATYRGFNVDGVRGVTAVLQVELGGDGRFVRGRLVPMAQVPGRGPWPDATNAAITLVRELGAADFGADAAHLADDGAIEAPGGTDGR